MRSMPQSMISVHSHQGWRFSLMGSPPLKSFLRGCSGWRTGVYLYLCWSAKWTLSLWSSFPYILAPIHLSWSLHNPWCQRQIHTYTALDSRSIRIPPEWQMEKWKMVFIAWGIAIFFQAINVMSFSINNPYHHHFVAKISSLPLVRQTWKSWTNSVEEKE